MMTIFALPKPFRGSTAVIQHNAVRSWLQLRPACEVMLFGDEDGTADLAAKLSLRHVPEIERNQHQTPLVNALFATAERLATHPFLCYVNADIILMTDFLSAVVSVAEREPRSLMICRRWDVDLRQELDFRANWERDLAQYVRRNGRRRPHTAIDAFVFPRGLWSQIPPFALGRGMWDNWLVFGARAAGRPVVDLSEAALIVHQNHDYAHQGAAVRTEADVWLTQEAQDNLALGGGYAHAFSAYDATHVWTGRGLRRNITPYALYRALATQSAAQPLFAPMVSSLRAAYGKCRTLGRFFLWRLPL